MVIEASSPPEPNSETNPALSSVRIVLVAPAGPLNVGSTARVMKNFGLSQLILVSPQCDLASDEALQMAVHAKDVLTAAQRVDTIPEALVGCHLAIATTARARGFNAPLELPENALPSLINSSVETCGDTALLFGPEDRGLSNEELSYAQRFIQIPTSPDYSALNLAQAVAVCCYELYRAYRDVGKRASMRLAPTDAAGELQQSMPAALRLDPLSGKQSNAVLNKAPLDELERYYQHLERVLLKVEYLYPHTAASRMRKLRQLLHRAAPSANEVALLRGILRQMEWALSASKPDSKPNSKPDPKPDPKPD
ncbi:MAG: RNA methyltransferase [Phormidesmis sp.]